MEITLKTRSSRETNQLGQRIGTKLKGGEVIELVSDLGGGKTTFVGGLASGAGSEDVVASPSFTISYVYLAPKFNLHHYDFYRLSDPGVVKLSLSEAISDQNNVVMVEWGDIVSDALPQNKVTINLKLAREDESTREIIIDYPEQLAYLFEGLNL